MCKITCSVVVSAEQSPDPMGSMHEQHVCPDSTIHCQLL